MPDAPARLRRDPRRGRGGHRRGRPPPPSSRSCACAYLGRKAELTTMLRSIGDLPAEQRGPVGKGANEVKVALEALLDERTRDAGGGRAGRAAAPRRHRRDAARRPAGPGRPPAPDHPDPARDRGRLPRPRLLGGRGARGRVRLLQLHRAQPPARTTRRGCWRTPSTSPRTCCCARTPRRCRCARWSCRSRRSTSIVPGKTYRRDSDATHTPDVPPGRGPGDRRGHHPGRPPGRAAGVRAGDLRPRARDPPAPALLPVHRAERGGRRLLLRLRRQGLAGGRLALLAVQGLGLDRDPRLGHGRPQRARLRGRQRLRPRARCRASRSGWASSGSRCSRHGVPDLRLFFENDVRFLEQFGA